MNTIFDTWDVAEGSLIIDNYVREAHKLLLRYLKLESIPTVIRKPCFDDESLLDLVIQGRTKEMFEHTKNMFDWTRVRA